MRRLLVVALFALGVVPAGAAHALPSSPTPRPEGTVAAGFTALRFAALRFTGAKVATRRALAVGRAFITRRIFTGALLAGAFLSGAGVGQGHEGNTAQRREQRAGDNGQFHSFFLGCRAGSTTRRLRFNAPAGK